MSIVSQIRQWLSSSRVYVQGVQLYRQIGGDYPARMFEAYMDAHYVPADIEERLLFSLQRYASTFPPDDQAIHKTSAQQQKQLPQQPATTGEPEQIRQLREKGKKLLKEQAYMHSRLSAVGCDNARYRIAQQMMEELIPAIDEVYDTIRNYERTGELPTISQNDIVRETVKKMQRLDSLRSRISRLKSFLSKSSTPADKRQKYKKELLEKQIELKELEEYLPLS